MKNRSAGNSTVSEIVEYRTRQGWTVVEILQEIQRQQHRLSQESIEELSRCTGVPLSRLYSIATYYDKVNGKLPGRHHICVCGGHSCHVNGGQRVLERFEEELGIRAGETSADGGFSLESVDCVGACAVAPVVVVDENLDARVGETCADGGFPIDGVGEIEPLDAIGESIYGAVTSEEVAAIVARIKGGAIPARNKNVSSKGASSR